MTQQYLIPLNENTDAFALCRDSLFRTNIRRIVAVLGFCFFSSNAFPAAGVGIVCSTNASGEITNTSPCDIGALSYEVRVYDVLWCESEPSPGNFDSCFSWDVEPFDWEITPNARRDVIPRILEFPSGTYSWVSVTISPTTKIRAVATFDRAMTGKTGTGQTCWTNGTLRKKSESLPDEPDRSKWTVECGTNPPADIPTNQIVTDSASNMGGGSNFDNSSSGVLPTGQRYRSYLVTETMALSGDPADTDFFSYNLELNAPITVTGRTGLVQTMELIFNRELGATLDINSTVGVNNLSRINEGIMYWSVDYFEIQKDMD